ncbi:MAG: nitroreductase family protein [Candidatus Bathyarchaeota archaeon]|nr:MAG: nitroreductase family protein [Candidatus Bathyarchaeota archaeon]
MEFYEAVNKRRSVREFQTRPVEKGKLRRVLEAGLKAPSHNHLREWEFILIKDIDRRKEVFKLEPSSRDFTDEMVNEWAKDAPNESVKDMYLKALPIQRRMLMNAPELLVVCFRLKKTLKECRTLFDLNCFASVWACIENILLAMAAEGLYGVTKIPYETISLKKALRLPEDYEVAAIIPIGYPEGHLVRQKTVSLQEKTHHDKW